MKLPAGIGEDRAALYRAQGYWSDETLRGWLRAAAQRHGGRVALEEGARRITWASLEEEAAALENGLDRLGLGRGDVVAVQLPNTVEFVVAYLAITGRGAVMQTLQMPYRRAELEPLLRHSGAAAVIAAGTDARGYSAAAHLADLRSELPALRRVIAAGDAPPGTESLAGLIAAGRTGAPAQPPSLSGEDPFLLLYTSGTTSRPKGVPHQYRAFLGNSRASAAALGVSAGDRLLSAAPFTHAYGLFTLNMALAVGATSLLLPAFTPGGLAALLAGARPTLAFTAPAHIAACFAQGLFDGADLTTLRWVQISGSAVPPELGRRLEPLLGGGTVMQLWGMTELQAGAFTRPGDSESVRIETTGRPSPGSELRVVRDDGCPAAAGESGELQMRGPSLFAGYLDDPEATRAAFTPDGWFRTGDLASMDAGGNTRLQGRTKDIVNRGGVKLNPADIEAVVLRHPSIAEAAVVAVPDTLLGERACLCAVLRPGASLALEDLQAWLAAQQVAKIRWPEHLALVDSMPMTPTRKVIKSRLLAQVLPALRPIAPADGRG